MDILVLHFRPISLYPPVLNLLKYISENTDLRVIVLTSSTKLSKHVNYKNVEVIEAFPHEFKGFKKILFAKFRYFRFYLMTLLLIVKYKFCSIIFYESISVIGLWLSKQLKLLSSDITIAAHYHEYYTPKEIKNLMLLEQIGYRTENAILKSCDWVSHTNVYRRNLFLKDKKYLSSRIVHAMPNFPSINWSKSENKITNISQPIKLVFVGALSLEDMYVKEVIDWIHKQNGRLTLDIISLNIKDEVLDLIQEDNSETIQYIGSYDYVDLPQVLVNYDVGLILYNGNSTNFIYNAPNKLFEYLACGLDVWFSKDLVTSKDYIIENSYPKILEVDFNRLNKFDYQFAISRKGLFHKPTDFYCESVYQNFLKSLELIR